MRHDAAIQAFEAGCRKRGLPVTLQRRAVLEEILDRRDHPTADQVFEALSSRLGGVSRATVYRALDTLVDLGLVRRMAHAGAVARFDPVHRAAPPPRLRPLRQGGGPTGRIGGPIVAPPKAPPGFTIRDYTVHFTGICSNCRNS